MFDGSQVNKYTSKFIYINIKLRKSQFTKKVIDLIILITEKIQSTYLPLIAHNYL